MTDVLSRIEACIPALRRYAWALLRGRHDADDLVHDTLVRALNRLHTLHDDMDPRAWLLAIMHNLFVSQARRAKTRNRAEQLASRGEAEPGSPSGQEDQLRLREMECALEALPEEQRVVLLLITLEDLPYAEAARVLGVPIGTVMSRLARARERLRQAIHEEARPCLRRVK
jgi:RNA polymerase sigma factor (sigma-70 family)